MKEYSIKLTTCILCEEFDMSDEVHFHLTGSANKQNRRYCAPSGDNPHIIHEKPLHDPCVTIWACAAMWRIALNFTNRQATFVNFWLTKKYQTIRKIITPLSVDK